MAGCLRWPRWVKSVGLCDRPPPLDFRHAPLAVEVAPCNAKRAPALARDDDRVENVAQREPDEQDAQDEALAAWRRMCGLPKSGNVRRRSEFLSGRAAILPSGRT